MFCAAAVLAFAVAAACLLFAPSGDCDAAIPDVGEKIIEYGINFEVLEVLEDDHGDYLVKLCVISHQTGYTGDVEIPGEWEETETVGTDVRDVRYRTVAIGERAFYGDPLHKLSIPKTVSTIGYEAFEKCVNLLFKVESGNETYRSVDGVLYDRAMKSLVRFPEKYTGTYTLPYSVETIENSALAYSRLTGLTIPAPVSIDINAFYKSELKMVRLHGDSTVSCSFPTVLIVVDGDNMSDSLKNVRAENGTLIVTSYQLQDADKKDKFEYAVVAAGEGGHIDYYVTTEDVPRAVAKPDLGHVFEKWANGSTLQDVKISGTTNTSASFAFTAPNMGDRYLHEGIEYVVAVLSSDLLNAEVLVTSRSHGGYTGDIVIPEAWTGTVGSKTYTFDVIGIADSAFINSNISSVSVPPTVKVIGENAFDYCEALVAVTFEGDSQLTEIGGSAFYDCKGLEYLELPAGLTTLGEWALENCESLDVAVAEGNGSFKVVDGVLYDHAMKKLVWFPVKRTGHFVAPENVETIGDSAFAYSRLTGLTIPAAVELEGYAFFNSELRMLRLHGDTDVNCHFSTKIDLLVVDGEGMSDSLKNVDATYGMLVVTSYEVPPEDRNARYLYATVNAGNNCYVGYSVEEGVRKATAVPDAGYIFGGWAGTAQTGATITLEDGLNVAASAISADAGVDVRFVEDAADALACGAANPVLNLHGSAADIDMTAALAGFGGESVTINLPGGGGTWKLSGGKAMGAGTFIPAVAAIEPTEDMRNAAGGFANAVYLEFSAAGKLPFAKNEFTTAKADWMEDGKEYGLYLWDAAAKEFVEKGTATVAGGKATMSLERCSVYAVADPVPSADGTLLYVGVAIAAIAAIAVVVLFVYPGILRKR